MQDRPHREHARAAPPLDPASPPPEGLDAHRGLDSSAQRELVEGDTSSPTATSAAAGLCADHAVSRAVEAPPRLFAALEAELDAVDTESRPLKWRPLLAGSSPREILARIVPEDPLGVRSIVAARLRQQAYLLDADRVHLRALALCARWAPRYQGQPEIHTWLARLVDQSITELLREEQEELARVEEPCDAGVFHALALPLGLDPRSIQLGCRAFNRLALDDRAAFFELVLRGRSLDELAREGGRLAVELARSARRALDVFALHGASAPMRTRGAASARDEGAVRPRDAAASRRLREEGTR